MPTQPELLKRLDDMAESFKRTAVVDEKPRLVYLPEETGVQRGVEALVKALGPVEAVRFLSLPRQRLLDYVQWHRQWQTSLDQKSFFDAVFEVGNSTL